MSMRIHMAKTTIITLLVSLTLFCTVYFLRNRRFELEWSGFYALVPPLIPGLIMGLAALAWVIMAFRATMVTWITVLVLLTFASNRRRVLVRRGSLITGEVTKYFVPLIFRQKGLFAVACAALLSLLVTLR